MADKITMEQKWGLATEALTGAYIATAKALKESVGQQGFDEFARALWSEAGKGIKAFASSAGLPTGTPEEIETACQVMAKASMGPEFAFQIVEATADRCVARATGCPWHKRSQEQGVDFDSCGAGHQSWGEAVVASVNPSFEFKLSKNMNCGDSYCEWTIERKK